MPYKHLKTAQKQAQNIKTRRKNNEKWPKNVIKRQLRGSVFHKRSDMSWIRCRPRRPAAWRI